MASLHVLLSISLSNPLRLDSTPSFLVASTMPVVSSHYIQEPCSLYADSHPGNKPPWVLPAKGQYLNYDSKRALNRVGLSDLVTPDLMKVGNTVVPLRALHFVKANYSKEIFLATLGSMFVAFWGGGEYANLSDEESLRRCLQGATDKPIGGNGTKLFTDADVKKILDGRAAMKTKLSETTAKALELGAFGTPWFWATNSKGEGQPFFGSDRYVIVFLSD